MRRHPLLLVVALLASGCFNFEALSSQQDASVPDLETATDLPPPTDLPMDTDIVLPDLGDGVVRTGTISLSQNQFETGDMGFVSSTVFANFFATPSTEVPGTPSCTFATTQSPSCQIVRCANPDLGMVDMADAPIPDMAVVSAPHAGTITASGFSGSPSMVTLTPGPNGVYDLFNVNVSLWAGGETLTIEAPGAEVPAFKQDLVAPSPIRVTSPSPAAVTPLKRAEAFAPTWTGGAFGDVTLTVSANGAAETVSLLCTGSASAHTLAIPATTMSELPAGATAFVTLSTRSLTVSVVGGWSLNLQATQSAKNDADGSFYTYSTTVE